MLFSVIIPMYNAEKYISDCIESVINQTFNDFEIIVVNDGSNDLSLNIIKEYAITDKRIKIINQSNQGLFYSRCVGIENSNGEYIIFVDADDKLKINALEKIRQNILEGNYDMIIYSAEFLYNNGRTKPFIPLFKSDRIFQKNEKIELYEEILKSNNLNNMWIKAIRSKCFDLNKIKNLPQISMGEDLLHTLFPLTNSNTIKYINDILYQYRINDKGMTRTFNQDVYRSTKVIYFELKKLLKEEWQMDSDNSYNLLNKRFLESVAKIVLYSPADISNYEKKYINTLESINNDELFKSILKENKNKLSLNYRFPIVLLITKRYNLLIIMKKIIVKIRKMLKR